MTQKFQSLEKRIGKSSNDWKFFRADSAADPVARRRGAPPSNRRLEGWAWRVELRETGNWMEAAA